MTSIQTQKRIPDVHIVRELYKRNHKQFDERFVRK